MPVDISLASKDYGENIKTASFQPTLWLLSIVEVLISVDICLASEDNSENIKTGSF